MIIVEALRKEIENDIARCTSHTERNGSESLYGELVAKYTIVDPNFEKGLSMSGKAVALGSDADFRKELIAVAGNLRILLLTNSMQEASTPSDNPLKLRIEELIRRGEQIKESELQTGTAGLPFTFVSGPKLDAWMGEIQIINTRYLSKHPLYNSINSTYFHYKRKQSSCDDMLGHLRAIAADSDFFSFTAQPQIAIPTSPAKSIGDLLAEDIRSCQDLLEKSLDEEKGRKLYSILTSRYDSVIKDLGTSLYAYNPEHHFYDPDISLPSLHHNLNVVLQKMIIHHALNFVSIPNKHDEKLLNMSNKVFIVHGHDEAAKETMARTLERAGFEAIILHEQASNGMTIIEKIEANTNVAYSVVLYTPCDIGRGKSEPNDKERARQNVIFEHGYLIGKLGRNRVCALVKGHIETPGDISGVVYIKMDESGAWKIELAKNMRAAGLSVDLNTFCS